MALGSRLSHEMPPRLKNFRYVFLTSFVVLIFFFLIIFPAVAPATTLTDLGHSISQSFGNIWTHFEHRYIYIIRNFLLNKPILYSDIAQALSVRPSEISYLGIWISFHYSAHIRVCQGIRLPVNAKQCETSRRWLSRRDGGTLVDGRQ